MWTQREKHKEDIELVSVRTAENFKIAMLWIYGAFITFSLSLLVVSLSYICIFKSAIKQFHRTLAGENSKI